MGRFIEELKRTHYCDELNASHVGQEVVLFGWVDTRRDHGNVMFVDFRDLRGMTQIVFNPEIDSQVHELGKHLRSEYVMGIRGKVSARPEGMANPKLKTGAIEVLVEEFELFNRSKTPPIEVIDDLNVSEDLRLKYRYLDLRRRPMAKIFQLRHRVSQAARNYLDQNNFLELETPILTKSTPEGARDYLVPSRVHPGSFFALPQSPQLFKQLLMVSGFDRYYQIVKCFRDEDLRADRQPEFTQVDMELSFVSQEDVIRIMEGLVRKMWQAGCGIDLPESFPRMTYDEALENYGLDAPDTRFDLKLVNVSDIFAKSDFKVFAGALKGGGVIKAINVKGKANMSRSQIDDLTKFVSVYGARGLAYIKVGDEWQSPIVKFFSEEEKQALQERLNIEKEDLIFFGADSTKIVNDALGQLRKRLGQDLGLIDAKALNFVWVVDFPMFEADESGQSLAALHHPFTSPKPEDLPRLSEAPLEVKANAYDLVLNGHEIGGGSIRIHDSGVQSQVFSALGIGEEEAKLKFGFLLDALQFGAPPHGGIAFGLDRIIMLMSGATSIRDVIAFPKTQKAACPLTDAPTQVDLDQLMELSIRLDVKK